MPQIVIMLECNLKRKNKHHAGRYLSVVFLLGMFLIFSLVDFLLVVKLYIQLFLMQCVLMEF